MVPHYKQVRDSLRRIALRENKAGDLARFLLNANRIRRMATGEERAFVTPRLELNYDFDSTVAQRQRIIAQDPNLVSLDGQQFLDNSLIAALQKFIFSGKVESRFCSGKTHIYALIEEGDTTIGFMPISHVAAADPNSWLDLELEPGCGCDATLNLLQGRQSYLPWNLVAAANAAPIEILLDRLFEIVSKNHPVEGGWGKVLKLANRDISYGPGQAISADLSSMRLKIGEKSFRAHLGLLKGSGISSFTHQLRKSIPPNTMLAVNCDGESHHVAEFRLANGRITRVPLNHLDAGLDDEIFYGLSHGSNCFKEIQGYDPWRLTLLGGDHVGH